MKKYAAVYFVCFWLLIFGAFASMAQYTYGLKVSALGCLGLLLTFLHELVNRGKLSSAGSSHVKLGYVELISMSVIVAIYMLRNLSFEFLPAIPILWCLLVILVCLQVYFTLYSIRSSHSDERALSIAFIFYYGSIILLIGSLLTYLLAVVVSTILFGFAVIALLLSFILFYRLNFSVTKEMKQSPSQYLIVQENHSVVVLAGVFLICSYNLLYYWNVLPAMYMGTLPGGYQKLVNQSLTKEDAEKAGLYKMHYDEFVERHGDE